MAYAMEDRHRKRLQKNRIQLVRNLKVDEEFLAHFTSNELFNVSTKQRIQIKQVDSDRAGFFLDTLVKCGPTAFSVLMTALRETSQGHLADMVDDPPASTQSAESAPPRNTSAASANIGSTRPTSTSELYTGMSSLQQMPPFMPTTTTMCSIQNFGNMQVGDGNIQNVNQGPVNQGMPNQGMPSQGMPNQGMQNQGIPNQGMPSQIPSLSSPNEFLMSRVDLKKINDNYPHLVKNMIVNTTFLAHLRPEVLDSSREQEIQTQALSADKAAAVLRYIESGSSSAFKSLLRALIETSQEHLAAMLDESLTDKLKREMSSQDERPRLRLPQQESGDPGEPSTVPLSPTDETDLTQTDSIMKVEIKPIIHDDAVTKGLIEKSRKGKDLYKMLSKPRGRAVIINIDKFVNESKNREGAEFDSENLTSLFEKLHFDVKLHTCHIRKITAKKLKKIIQDEAKDDFHKDVDCLVVFVLSHGGQGYVLGSDGQKVSIKNDIEAPFYGTNCGNDHLKGKPKILFINACRVKPGDQDDRGSTELTGSMEAMSLQGPVTMADLKDFFRFYSTSEGLESFRNPKLGSIFVRVIVAVFQAYAYKFSLDELIFEVNRRYPFLTETQHHNDKKIYFFPGYDGR